MVKILVGPVKLSKNKKLRAKALRQAQMIIDGVNRWEELDSDRSKKDKVIVRLMDRYGSRDYEDWTFLRGVDPKQALDDLFELWHGTKFGDVNWRSYTGQPPLPYFKLRIMVAGDSTWGDDPNGPGYLVCLQAQYLGLFALYGIR
jgi:hypothetical protein